MEILKLVITILFVIAALAIIVVVLLQEGKSAGLGSLSGATSNNDSYWEKNKKNTLEGKFETWTKVTAGLFVVFALVLMLLQSSPASVQVNPAESTTGGNITTEVQPEGEKAADQATDQKATETKTDNADATATESPAAQDDASASKAD